MVDPTTAGASIGLMMAVLFLGWIALLALCCLGVSIRRCWRRR